MSSKNSNVSLYNSKYLKYKNKYLSLKKMLGGKDDDNNKRYLIVSSPDKEHPYIITLNKGDQLLPGIAKNLNKSINQIQAVQNGINFNDNNKSVEEYGIGNTIIKINFINPVIKNKDDILPIIIAMIELSENEFMDKNFIVKIDNKTGKKIYKIIDKVNNKQILIDKLMRSISFDGDGNIMDILFMDYNLKKLPDNFTNIELLGTLNLSYNYLTALPENFGDIKVGDSLHLEHNKLETLPETFGKITVGKELYLEDNQLETLPESFGNIKIGNNINLANNKLKSLPISFKNIDGSHDIHLYSNLIEGKIPERLHMSQIQKSYAQLEVDNNKAKEIIRQRK